MTKNHTRKQKKQKEQQQEKKKGKIMTIPQLRKAFESINNETHKVLSKHPINEDSISSFQKSWKHIFGKNIDSSTAESYLILQSKSKNKGTRKMKKQKGGSAPVDYMLRPGSDGTYGSFLPYVSSGLSFYNNINNIAMDSDCGKVDITPTISDSMGSNKVQGGGFQPRLIGSSVPPSLLQDAQDSYIGRPLGSSSNPLDNPYRGL
jgi:hypothetical protein